jgi:3-isopropylmalate/(R)-2-methylmalate dehydratase small subunit
VPAEDGSVERWPFEIDPFARHCLLRGLDRFDFLVQAEDAIAAYEDSA